ncbi:uncharacterized protein LOC103308380 [Acyrthosiphon pisum]|uniref:Zinc finger MYM-type protein 1-like n=1 Tax=Acyrthosiphon pisum TaxID=7029 RepID=A0A8R1X1J8_ACYPI|nr:uncharacterized protein LOC103308380 [Acyrthosiphon pisum]|eukprot:XP_008179863.1 PREDICTED: uncharacterized protein LOC103308380 [Acyrthosiphon pisum]
MTKIHNEANSHKTSFAKYQGFVTSKSVGAVTLQINSHVEENITKNREILKSIIRSILYCARQDIGLRGHYNVNTSLNKNLENTEQTNNQGNLKELVDLLCLENEKFDKDLKSLPKNAKYTSNIVQNDILLASSNIITQTIVKEVNEGSSVYSLIVDEARDASTLEQMSICIKYVHKSIIKERFLGFVQVLKLDAQGLTHCIIEFLNAVGLDIEKCISQSYDEICDIGKSFEEIKSVIERVLVIPVSSASAERSFSSMRRIKTYLRTSMTTTRLHNLALISIEREFSSELLKDPTKIIDEPVLNFGPRHASEPL